MAGEAARAIGLSGRDVEGLAAEARDIVAAI
jgi:hypothetical protein